MIKSLVKVTLVLMVTFFITSCKRDFKCNCTLINSGEYIYYDTAINNSITKDAIYYCEEVSRKFARDLVNGDTNDTIIHCNLNKIK